MKYKYYYCGQEISEMQFRNMQANNKMYKIDSYCEKGNDVIKEYIRPLSQITKTEIQESKRRNDSMDSMANMLYGLKYVGDRKQRVDCLPKDVDNVMVNGTTVIVTLTDKRKGIAKCMGGDYFDVMNGFKNAYYNAHNDGVGKLKKVLEGCVESAKRKGYKQAILKNYDDVKQNDVKLEAYRGLIHGFLK